MNADKAGFGGMVKLGIILALYSTVACVGLAFVYTGTKTIIDQRAKADQDAALKDLFPDADSFKAIPGIVSADPAVTIEGDENDPDDSGAFAAYKNSLPIGMALKTSRFSYGGDIKCLVGVSVDGKISGVKILEHKDTPGLGANAGSPRYYVDRAKGIHFYDQFVGKKVTDTFLVKQDIISITAATITSRAVSDSVKAAGLAAAAWFASEGGSR